MDPAFSTAPSTRYACPRRRHFTETFFLADSDTVTEILSVCTTAFRYGNVRTVLFRRWSLPIPAHSSARAAIFQHPSFVQVYTGSVAVDSWYPGIFGLADTSPLALLLALITSAGIPSRVGRFTSGHSPVCRQNISLDALPPPSCC